MLKRPNSVVFFMSWSRVFIQINMLNSSFTLDVKFSLVCHRRSSAILWKAMTSVLRCYHVFFPPLVSGIMYRLPRISSSSCCGRGKHSSGSSSTSPADMEFHCRHQTCTFVLRKCYHVKEARRNCSCCPCLSTMSAISVCSSSAFKFQKTEPDPLHGTSQGHGWLQWFNASKLADKVGSNSCCSKPWRQRKTQEDDSVNGLLLLVVLSSSWGALVNPSSTVEWMPSVGADKNSSSTVWWTSKTFYQPHSFNTTPFNYFFSFFLGQCC